MPVLDMAPIDRHLGPACGFAVCGLKLDSELQTCGRRTCAGFLEDFDPKVDSVVVCNPRRGPFGGDQTLELPD